VSRIPYIVWRSGPWRTHIFVSHGLYCCDYIDTSGGGTIIIMVRQYSCGTYSAATSAWLLYTYSAMSTSWICGLRRRGAAGRLDCCTVTTVLLCDNSRRTFSAARGDPRSCIITARRVRYFNIYV